MVIIIIKDNNASALLVKITQRSEINAAFAIKINK